VAAAILNYGYVDFFRRHRCALNQSSNIPTKFGDDWSKSKEMATVFFQICISDVIDMFEIEVPMFPLILVMIGKIVKKWQQFFEIQDGGDRRLEFSKVCIFDVIDIIKIEVPMFSQLLVKIIQIV